MRKVTKIKTEHTWEDGPFRAEVSHWGDEGFGSVRFCYTNSDGVEYYRWIRRNELDFLATIHKDIVEEENARRA